MYQWQRWLSWYVCMNENDLARLESKTSSSAIAFAVTHDLHEHYSAAARDSTLKIFGHSAEATTKTPTSGGHIDKIARLLD